MSSGRDEDGGHGRRPVRQGENFFGTVTVGERGQIVIPAEARRRYGIETGDKLLAVGHGDKGLMLFKIDALRALMDTMMEDLRRAESGDGLSEDTHDGG